MARNSDEHSKKSYNAVWFPVFFCQALRLPRPNLEHECTPPPPPPHTHTHTHKLGVGLKEKGFPSPLPWGLDFAATVTCTRHIALYTLATYTFCLTAVRLYSWLVMSFLCIPSILSSTVCMDENKRFYVNVFLCIRRSGCISCTRQANKRT